MELNRSIFVADEEALHEWPVNGHNLKATGYILRLVIALRE